MHVTADLFPGDFLDQMPKSGSPEKTSSAEKETDPCSLLQSSNSISLQSLLLPQSIISPGATQTPNPCSNFIAVLVLLRGAALGVGSARVLC